MLDLLRAGAGLVPGGSTAMSLFDTIRGNTPSVAELTEHATSTAAAQFGRTVTETGLGIEKMQGADVLDEATSATTFKTDYSKDEREAGNSASLGLQERSNEQMLKLFGAK